MVDLITFLHPFMPQIVTSLSGGLTFAIVAGVKKAQSVKYSSEKKAILRPVAAVLSFLGVLILSIATDTNFDQGAVGNIVDILVQSALAFGAATTIHEVKNG